MANLTSFLILALFLYGRSLRFKNLRLHIRNMLSSMVLDILLVLMLILHRDALSKVGAGMPWTLQIHVPIAISTVGLYVVTCWTGYRLYRGDERARPQLRVLDKFMVTFRVLTLVTSLMVQGLK